MAAAVAGVYWWERQLPGRIQQAADEGRLEDCTRLSEQLVALSWLHVGSSHPQGRCRRDLALQLWQQESWAEALRQQQQLVNSPSGTADDRQRLQGWQVELRRTAMARFQSGDLEGALTALAPMGEDRNSSGSAIGDGLREIWTRNRMQLERSAELEEASRWWEALEALNRIDHPWWQQESTAIRERVQSGIDALGKEDQEHDSHGALPHTVPPERLQALVEQRLARGMDDWSAFQDACRELGGSIVEAGPETACQR